MADNTRLPQGSQDGDTYASDDIAGVKTQRVKITLGADGVNDGDVASGNPMPVGDGGGSLTTDTPQLPAALVGGRLDVNVGAGSVAVAGTVDTELPAAAALADGAGNPTTPTVGAAALVYNGATWDRARGDTANGLDVDVTRLPALVAGSAVIGKVSLVDGAGDNAMDDANNAVRVNVVAGGGSGGDGAILDGVSAAIKATVLDYTNANPLAVRLTDTNGDYAAAGGGTQYTEDAAAAADPVGTALIMVRDDALSAQTSADGDNVAARGTDTGELYVKHVDAIPVTDNGGVLTVDGAVSLAAAIPAGTNNIGDVDIATVPAPLSTTGGGTEAAALRVTLANDSTGVVSVDDNGATLSIDDGGGIITVDGTVAVTQATASNLNAQVVGAAAHDAAVSGNPVLAAGRASAAAPTDVSADGDAVSAWRLRNGAAATVITAAGALIGGDAANGLDVDVTRVPAPLSTTGGGTEATALRVTIASDSTGVVSVDDGGGILTVDGTVTANAGTGTFTAGGVAAHDAAVSGNPVLLGAEARDALPTAVANGDVVRIQADDNGRLVTCPHSPRELVDQGTTTYTSTTEANVLAAGGASVFLDLTMIVLTNTSATGVRVDIRDASAGTVRLSVFLAANGGGAVIPFQAPMKQTTANSAWTAQLSAAVTDVRVFMQAVRRN
jgi:hypothetical protein